MNPDLDLVNWAPLLELLALGAAVAALPLAWVLWRQRSGRPGARERALIVLTLFLTFDLVLFGSFTRLTDSGLGCPDWPGCYGEASPLGAQAEIAAEQARLPDGPVTVRKAWVEMVHRYLASGVGALILLLAVLAWRRQARARRLGPDPALADLPSRGLALFTLGWVLLQGAFGAWTVTLKLYPAIVTAHLLGGLTLLGLLAAMGAGAQQGAWRDEAPAGARAVLGGLLALVVAQIALGGWVSTNYAVLACQEFPRCQGQWWPPMDWAHGFQLLRPLGATAGGGWLPFEALTAIHMLHRLGAALLLAALLGVALWLRRSGAAGPRRLGLVLLALGGWQLASGVSNVVLGWPLAAAVAHVAGAAGLVLVLVRALRRCSPPVPQAGEGARSPGPAGRPPKMAGSSAPAGAALNAPHPVP